MSTSEHLVLHLGATGSGKTWRLKTRVAAAVRVGWTRQTGMRVLVADVKREWPRGPKDPPRTPLTSGSAIPMARVTGRVPAADAELPDVTIARPVEGWPEERIEAWHEQLVRFALERRRVVLVSPEVWRYAPQSRQRLPPGLAELAHEHRHRDVCFWADAQSYPEVNKELVRRCGTHVIHGTDALEDLDRLQRMGGRPLRAAVLRAMQLNDERGPGHFVVYQRARPLGPFVLRGPDGRAIG